MLRSLAEINLFIDVQEDILRQYEQKGHALVGIRVMDNGLMASESGLFCQRKPLLRHSGSSHWERGIANSNSFFKPSSIGKKWKSSPVLRSNRLAILLARNLARNPSPSPRDLW
jgi:hypothetical protein